MKTKTPITNVFEKDNEVLTKGHIPHDRPLNLRRRSNLQLVVVVTDTDTGTRSIDLRRVVNRVILSLLFSYVIAYRNNTPCLLSFYISRESCH